MAPDGRWLRQAAAALPASGHSLHQNLSLVAENGNQVDQLMPDAGQVAPGWMAMCHKTTPQSHPTAYRPRLHVSQSAHAIGL